MSCKWSPTGSDMVNPFNSKSSWYSLEKKYRKEKTETLVNLTFNNLLFRLVGMYNVPLFYLLVTENIFSPHKESMSQAIQELLEGWWGGVQSKTLDTMSNFF